MSAAYDPAATRERLIARRALAQANLDSLRKQVANLLCAGDAVAR